MNKTSSCLTDGWTRMIQQTNRVFSLCRRRPWSSTPPALPCAQTGTAPGILDEPHGADASARDLTQSPEQHGGRRPRDSLGRRRGREASRARLTVRAGPGARGRARGGDGR